MKLCCDKEKNCVKYEDNHDNGTSIKSKKIVIYLE